MLLMAPMAYNGNKTYQLNVLVYTMVFLTYAFLRLGKEYEKTNDEKWPLYIIVVLIFTQIFLLMLNPLNEVHTGTTTTNQREKSDDSTEGDEEMEVHSSTQAEVPPRGDKEMEVPSRGDEKIVAEVSLRYPDFQFSDYGDGVYDGKAEGYRGLVTVTVTITDGALESLTLDHHTDDARYMDKATLIREDILLEQSLEVDTVSGATFSSNGIIDATYNALEGIIVE